MANTMTARVELVDGMTFRASSGSGHSLVLDAKPESGGSDLGPRPIELLLMGLGGCTGMDVISILRKMRHVVTGYEVRVTGDRAESHPMVYTDIEIEHVVRGRDLDVDHVRKAIELSATKYCGVSAMLGKTAKMVERFRVVDEASGSETVGTLALPEMAAQKV